MEKEIIIVPENGFEESFKDSLEQLSPSLHPMIERLLIPEKMIKERVHQVARQICKDYRREGIDQIQILTVLKGAVVFAMELAQQICLLKGPELRFNFVELSSYGDAMTSSGIVKIHGGLPRIFHKHVLIVEDIVDTGLTLSRLKDYLRQERQAADIRICALLDKKSRRLKEHESLILDYVGFEIPDFFVAGYGIDCAERLRELPFIVAVNQDYFQNKMREL